MTGYGRGEAVSSGWKVQAELSGVNRKQSDISVSLPAALLELEGEVRGRIAASISRGRVAAKVALSHAESGGGRLVVDESLARQYLAALSRIANECLADGSATVSDLFRAPGVFRLDESGADPDEVREPLLAAIDAALAQLVGMQQEEGAHLREDLLSRLRSIGEEVEAIRKLAPLVAPAYRENLRRRLAESGFDLDLGDERLLREIALYAERCDITEELTRLDSHLARFHSYFGSSEPVGRPLDFLCQEIHREINTIGSKANNAEISGHVVTAKSELEKIREQVQNVQ